MTNRNRRRVPGFQKRANLWLPFKAALTVATGSTNNVGTLLGRYLTEHGAEVPVGTTIGPIRGNYHVHAQTAGEQPVVFAAIYLSPEGGLASVPVLEDEQIDAMWYDARGLLGKVSEVSSGVFASDGEVYPLMTKAMRKITEIGQELRFQADEVISGGGVLIDVTGHIFMKLP